MITRIQEKTFICIALFYQSKSWIHFSLDYYELAVVLVYVSVCVMFSLAVELTKWKPHQSCEQQWTGASLLARQVWEWGKTSIIRETNTTENCCLCDACTNVLYYAYSDWVLLPMLCFILTITAYTTLSFTIPSILLPLNN